MPNLYVKHSQSRTVCVFADSATCDMYYDTLASVITCLYLKRIFNASQLNDNILCNIIRYIEG